MIHFLLPICLVASVLGGKAAAATAESCSMISIDTCPTFFKERCGTDQEFAASNALQCVRVLNETAADQEQCSKIDMAACTPRSCEESGDATARFFCERGKSSCTKTAWGLKAEFDDLLGELDARLLNYKDVIELDLSRVADLEALCAFPREELETFRTQATENADLLGGYEERLNEKKSCASTLNDFLQSERPEGLPIELWQNLKEFAASGLKEVAEREGVIRSQAENLAAAPQKLNALLVAHGIGCAQ